MKELKHLAIILDGNGRWAKERNMPRTFGHQEGVKNIKKIALEAEKLGIKVLSVYCFSTENWNRPKEEVNFLMDLPITFLGDLNGANKDNIKVIWSGRRTKVPKRTREELESLEEKTKDNTGIILNICFDYGALLDIKEAIMAMKDKDNFDESDIYQYLSTYQLGPVDLLIRPGGEKRLSNFLLLECAYAELYFTDVYWPDFSKEDLIKAIDDYKSRDRRFGSIK